MLPVHNLSEDDTLRSDGSYRDRLVSVKGVNTLYMSDVDHDELYRRAEAQAGYFTAQQAVATGMNRSTLRHHARPGGRYERVRRGLYRLRHFPLSPYEHVMAAWLSLRDAGAVVSNESALEMAIRQALERGMTTQRRLTDAASERSARVRKFVERRLEQVPA